MSEQRNPTLGMPGQKPQTMKVELLRGCVPADTVPLPSGEYPKRLKGEIIDLPKAEAIRLIELKAAAVTAKVLALAD